jgi:hypothetical protein
MKYEEIRKYFAFIASALTFFVFVIIVPSFGPEMIFKDTGEGIVASILVGIFFHTFQLFGELEKHKKDTADTIQVHIKKIVNVLRIQNEYFDDKWLFMVFDNVVDIVKFSKSNIHDLERVQGEIDNSLQKAKELIGAPFFIDNLERGEWSRIVYLNRAFENSQRIVQAVTMDERNYFDNFWQPLNSGYSKLNVDAAKRGVTIQRIFVMDGIILKKGKDEKTKKFWDLILDLKKGGSNISIYFLDKRKLLEYKELGDTSFFLCDGVVASESGREENNNGGYFSLNDKDRYANLKQKFEILLRMAEKI